MRALPVGSAAYLYPLAIKQADAISRTAAKGRLLTLSRGLATLLIKARGADDALALCLLSPEYAVFFRQDAAGVELYGLRVSGGQALFLPIKTVPGASSPRYSASSGKTGYALRDGAEYREHIFPHGAVYLQHSGFAVREGDGNANTSEPMRVSKVAARQNDFDFFAFSSALTDGARLSQEFSPDTSAEPQYSPIIGALPIGLSSLRGVPDPHSGSELSPQNAFRQEDAEGAPWPAAQGSIVDGALVHPAVIGFLEELWPAFSAQQGVWEIDGEAWFSEVVIIPSLTAVRILPENDLSPLVTYDSSTVADPDNAMQIGFYTLDEDRWGRLRIVAGGAVFSMLARLSPGDQSPVEIVGAARYSNVPSGWFDRVVGRATYQESGYFDSYLPYTLSRAFTAAYLPICDGSPHEKLFLKLRASAAGGSLTPFSHMQPPSMEIGAANLDWYSLLREGDNGVVHHHSNIGGDVVLYDMRSGAETTIASGPTNSLENKFQMFGASGASIIIGDTSYHIVAEGRNVVSPTVVVLEDDFGVPYKNWGQGSRIPLSTSWSLILRRGSETIALASGGGSALAAWGGAGSPPVYAGSSISSTIDHLFSEELASGRIVSNVANVAVLAAFRVGGEPFAVARIGVALTQAAGDYNSPLTVLQRVALVALDRAGAQAAPLFPTMSAAQWDAAGSFSEARIIPLGDDLMCVFDNGMVAPLRQALSPAEGAAPSFNFLGNSPADISGLTFIGASRPCSVRSNKVPEFPAFEGLPQ